MERVCLRMMNSNEHIHKPDGLDTELSDRLPDNRLPDNRLPDALKAAYPDPKGKIAGAVMAQIRAEREAEEKQQLRTTRMEARRRRQGLFMKWGGMAACMVILCGVLVIASPLMNRGADTAVMQAEAAVLTGATADAEAYRDEEGAVEDSVMPFTFTADEKITEEAAMTKSAPVKMAAEVEAAEAEEAVNAAAVYGADTMLADAAMDAAMETTEEREAFLQTLLDRGILTAEQYEAWMTASGYTDAGDWCIDELCAFFGIGAAVE